MGLLRTKFTFDHDIALIFIMPRSFLNLLAFA